LRRKSRLVIELEYAAARLLLATLRIGSRRFAFQTARAWVKILDLLAPRLRRTALKNLSLALPDLDEREHWRIARGSFHSIARLLVSLARMPSIHSGNIHEWIRYDGLEHFHAAKASGRGVLFATAHLGNWELSAFAHGLMTEPMHVVVRELDNPKIDALVRGLRRQTGNRVIEKRDFARGMLRALGANEAVGILVDQNTSLDEGIFVPFFGIPACVNPGLARMAARTGAPIIAGFALWNESEQRYVLRFDPPFEATGDLQSDTARVHAAIERAVREHPDQWLWLHRRWKTRPPGEAPIY
jgi:KDO2-lipid IV(A) lauroyltransferase